jgi:hypothetical protein
MEGAVSLANARSSFERALISRLMATRAAAVARLLLAPSRHAGLVAGCRRLEEGTAWTALLAAGLSTT